MKRTVLVGLLMITLAIVLAFSACGGNGTTTTTSSPTTSTTSPTTSTSPTTTAVKPTLPPVTLPNPQVERMTADDLAQKIAAGEDIVVVDLRLENEYEDSHILGSINIPSFPPGQALIDRVTALPKDKVLVFLCDCTDDGESAAIAATLPDYGYEASNLMALRGGWGYWEELNEWNPEEYPLE